MSVTPDWQSLRSYQIPRTLRHIVPRAAGSSADNVWRFGEKSFVEGLLAQRLFLRINDPMHGMIEPAEIAPVEEFQANLAATRDQWVKVEG